MIKVFVIGAGHGGMINGEYTTAPKKMYTFSDGKIAYEGVILREVVSKVMIKAKAKSIPIINIINTELDIPTTLRPVIVNDIAYRYGENNVLYMSMHGNAGKGTGFEIWTSPGDTPSDPFAKLYGDIYKHYFPKKKYRYGYTDGKLEADKEKPFWELMKTICPTILPEWDFYDTKKGFEFMTNQLNQNHYADMICEFMLEVMERDM